MHALGLSFAAAHATLQDWLDLGFGVGHPCSAVSSPRAATANMRSRMKRADHGTSADAPTERTFAGWAPAPQAGRLADHVWRITWLLDRAI